MATRLGMVTGVGMSEQISQFERCGLTPSGATVGAVV